MILFLVLVVLGVVILLVAYIRRTEQLNVKIDGLYAKIIEIESQLNYLAERIRPLGPEELQPRPAAKASDEKMVILETPLTEPTIQPASEQPLPETESAVGKEEPVIPRSTYEERAIQLESVTIPPPIAPEERPTSPQVIASTPGSIAEPERVRPVRTREEWEALIGGKLLNRIGALALIIGVGFFLKYAFDKNWITETMRVVIGAFVGLALLYGGMRFHRRGFQIFAQGIVGAGVSILYLSVYASFNFYHLVPQAVAFLLMAIVTAITFSQAFRYNSLAVSFLGWAGGFLTPILLSTGRANEVGLFTYIALLDVGLLLIILKKDSWAILEPFTWGATYLTYLLWYLKFYTPSDLFLTVFFLSVFWGLFYSLDLYRILSASYTFPEVRQPVAALNAAFYFVGMYAIINPRHYEWMGFTTVAIGAVYFLTILAVKRRRIKDRIVVARYLLTAIALLILATTIQFSGLVTVIWWSVEAMILGWCGTRWGLRYVWISSLALFGIALIKLVATHGALTYVPVGNFTPILNQRAAAFSFLIATLGTSTTFFSRLNENIAKPIRTILHYAWCTLLFGLCTIEANDTFRWLILGAGAGMRVYLRFIGLMVMAAVWMVYSFPLVWLGLRKNILPILYCGLMALGLSVGLGAIRGISFEPIENFVPGLNFRAALIVFSIIGLWIHGRWLGGGGETYGWMNRALHASQYAWSALLFLLCTVETNDLFRWLMINATGEEKVSLEFTRWMALAAIWNIYSIPMAWAGFRKKSSAVLFCGLGSLGLSILFGAIRGISFKPIEEFVLVLNFRTEILILITAGLTLHGLWLRNQRGNYSWIETAQTILQYSWCIFFFIVCTVEANDFFRCSMMNVTGRMRIGLEFTRLMTLPMVWMAYSMVVMWFGLRKKLLPFVHCSLAAVGVSVFLGFVRGFRFEPIEEFTLLTNLRALGVMFLVSAIFIHSRWLRRSPRFYPWVNRVLVVLQVMAILLILVAITGEIWDFFSKEMSLLGNRAADDINRLTNLKQMTLSCGWLLYSIVLMIIGIGYRIQRIRIIAILLFGVTILKIFVYDLSFLEALYRIFSFVGLGLILLATSYLYQRYKKIIFGGD